MKAFDRKGNKVKVSVPSKEEEAKYHVKIWQADGEKIFCGPFTFTKIKTVVLPDLTKKKAAFEISEDINNDLVEVSKKFFS